MSGHISHTGFAGFALHGGFGLLSRMYGLAVDNILAARIVLADGTLVEASPTSHPDLYWAIRGAGSSFGVVVAVKIQLFQVRGKVLGLRGNLCTLINTHYLQGRCRRHRLWRRGLLGRVYRREVG